MQEWFSEKKGYEVWLFGIVVEGLGNHWHQYNFIYGVGTKNGSNEVL